MTVENCDNCAFGVKEWMHHYQRLTCHRHAPIVFEGVTGSYTVPICGGELQEIREMKGAVTAWPQVKAEDFCGEFELKDAS